MRVQNIALMLVSLLWIALVCFAGCAEKRTKEAKKEAKKEKK